MICYLIVSSASGAGTLIKKCFCRNHHEMQICNIGVETQRCLSGAAFFIWTIFVI